MKRKSVKRSLTLLLTAMLSLSLAACSGNSANNESAPTAAPPADATAAPQEEATLNPDEPAWKLDTSPIDLTWFVGANWYAHSWGRA